jgi:hypothetical protein
MNDTIRLHLDWSGGSIVGPASTTLHFNATGLTISSVEVQSLVDQVHTALTGPPSNAWPAGVSCVVRPICEYLDSANGQIGSLVVAPTAPAGVNGFGTGSYSATSGAVASLGTAVRRNGHAVRGRAFLVPVAGSSYDGSGRITALAQSGWGGLFIGLATTDCGPLSIWSPNHKGQADGAISPVIAVRVSGKPAILRSRRQ